MREIKFRAWVKKWKEMREVYTIKWEDNSVFVEVDEYCPFFKIDEIKLMQYTSLKDRQGREIYEGDILKSRYICDCGYDHKFDNPLIIVDMKDFNTLRYIEQRDGVEFEIAGNIYENKDLLEE